MKDLVKDPINYRNRQFASAYTGTKGSDVFPAGPGGSIKLYPYHPV